MASPTHPILSDLDDLESDQANFFRRNLAVDPALDTEQAIAALSLSRNTSATTASHLPPIQERKPVRRRRRPNFSQNSSDKSAFPPVHVDEGGFRFGKRKTEKARAENGGSRRDGMLGEVDERIRHMSAEELAEARAEIEGLLSADSIRFLKERGKKRGNEVCDTSKSHQEANWRGGERNKSYDRGLMGKENDSELLLDADESEAEHATTSVTDVGRKIDKEAEAYEAEKRLWMSEATQEVAEQADVDQLLADAVRELGPLGKHRFNLEGDLLSPHEVESLPVHLGLHHHGSAPASAGYTLADLLLLTRSTVVTQRVVALRIVTVLVMKYREEVLEPLVKSGGLALVFAEFPPHAVFESALTLQVTYVEAVEAVVGEYWKVLEEELVPDLYFASRFYTGSLMEKAQSCFEVLANSGCPGMLVNVTRESVARNGGDKLACRSLAVLRAIVKSSAAAAKAVLMSDAMSKVLQQLACGSDPLHTSTVLLACDNLAQAVVSIGWEGTNVLHTLEKNVLSDEFLHKISMHLAWFLRQMPDKPQNSQYDAALGAIRLFRAALAFERGTVIFTASAQAVCRLTQDSKTSSEAFLALEAYAHALYTIISRQMGIEKKTVEDGTEGDMCRYAADQLSELLPMALSACRIFTSLRSPKRESTAVRRAAAGHFAATVLSTATIPLDKTIAASLLSECSEASRKIQSKSYRSKESLSAMQALASVCHAGARMLSRMSLDPAFAKREIASLMWGVDFESEILCDHPAGINPWRPVANACAEWIGSLAKVDCGIETARLGANLLPLLFDSQVILDLLSRCILKTQILTQMSKRITIEDARQCAQDLLPVALTDMHTLFIDEDEISPAKECRKGENSHSVFLFRIMNMWMKHAEIIGSVLNLSWAFFEGGLMEPVQLFQCLLLAPRETHDSTENLFSFMLAFARDAVKDGQCLLQATQTRISPTSTIPNSNFSESVLLLAEHLTFRGPQLANSAGSSDGLSSILMTIMCKKEADVSLRLSIWQKTIVECGGGMLYQNASYLPFEFGKSIDIETDEDDAILASYCAALKEGILIGERCPFLLGSIIVSRLNCRLRRGRGLQVLRALQDSLRDRTQTTAYESLRHLVQTNPNDNGNSLALISWFRTHAFYCSHDGP